MQAAFPADSTSVFRSVTQLGNTLVARAPSVLAALLVFVVFYLLARLLRAIVRRVSGRTRLDAQRAIVFSRVTSAAVITIGLLAAVVVIVPEFHVRDVIAGLGVASIAAGFVFRDILQNFFAGILMLWREPFQLGDEIRSREFEGKVEEINTRSTRIMTYSGERVILPNADLYMNPILVRTAFAKRRIDFFVGIGYGESTESAREVIMRAVVETDGVLSDPGPWVYVETLGTSSVNFHVYFWTGSQQENVLRVSDSVATRIKLALDDASIEIPYPHHVVMLRDQSQGASGAAG